MSNARQSRARRAGALLALLIVCSLLVVPAAQAAQPLQPAQPPAPPALHLKVGSFVPSLGQQPPLPANLPPGLLNAATRGNRAYYVVQFNGPVLQEWTDALRGAGAEILDYLPDFAYKVRANPAELNRIEELDGVIYVGAFLPAYKVSPNLRLGGSNLYTVVVEKGGDFGLTMAAIATTGAQVQQRSPDMLTVLADAGQIAAIASVADVAWIENYTVFEKHNETGAGSILGAATANTRGYDGSTQIAAVADTGLGGGTTSTAHPDVNGRVNQVLNYPGVTDSCFQTIQDDGAVDVDSGHGTHVALSVLGDGDANGVGRAAAPAARLVFQATENYVVTSNLCKSLYNYQNGYYLTGLNDLAGLFQQAYSAGARVHANSWGSAVAGDYTANSVTADAFINTNRNFLITFSAGNAGADANADGIVDNDSIGAPATAKNVLTVGASENARPAGYPCDTGLGYTSRDTSYQNGQTCAGMGGQNLLGTPRQRWGFTANPIADDPTAGNAQQMAAFSSRGPTDDNRIKPDVVAPGTWILSGYSGHYQEGYDAGTNPKNNTFQSDGWGMPFSDQYKYFGGTSMSNPVAAGGAVVVRDFYQKAHGLDATAALVKATLINSAVDLADENNDGANDNDFPIPNVHEGWGRVDLAAATDGSHSFKEEGTGLATNGTATYAYNVAGGAPFKVSLVWSDAPSTASASINLVNDLDLEITAPGGAVYRGNVFGGGWSQAGGSADRRNNVENVYVAGAAAGMWTVTVRGYNVPSGPQKFALVVDGGTETTPPPPPPGQTLHVGDLDGTRALGSKNWSATVVVTVHDANHAAVGNAVLAYSWSNGATGSGTCTTNGSGQCTLTRSIKNNVAGVTFNVTSITKSGYTYQASANHDPEADSNGTSIRILK